MFPFLGCGVRSPWGSLRWYVVFNCCMWIIPCPQCDRWNSHQEQGSESVPCTVRSKWNYQAQPCWTVTPWQPCLVACEAVQPVLWWGHGLIMVWWGGAAASGHSWEQKLSGWGDVMLYSSCYCPERVVVVWAEEGNGLCCCQERERSLGWLYWGSCSSSRAAGGFLWQSGECPFLEQGCQAWSKGEKTGSVGRREAGGQSAEQKERSSSIPGSYASSWAGAVMP